MSAGGAGRWIASITMSAISSDDEVLAGPGAGVELGAAPAIAPAIAPETANTPNTAAVATARIHMALSFHRVLPKAYAAKLTGPRLTCPARINLRGLGGAVLFDKRDSSKGAIPC